jgi:hypothetical protein
MDHVLEVIRTHDFLWGFFAGLAIGYLFWFLHVRCVAARERFCYLVTEHEYNLLRKYQQSQKGTKSG